MTKQFNFIIENKLITVYEKCKKQAEKEAKRIYTEMKEKV